MDADDISCSVSSLTAPTAVRRAARRAPRASFLRARRFDVEKAKQMLLDCEQWRRDFGVDDLVA